MADQHLRWFALRVRPRAEKAVADALRAKGYEEFLPLYRQKRRWTDRVVAVDFPLFPGYVFSRFNVQRRLPVLTVPGVMHVVGFGKVPEPVDDIEMESLQTLVRSRLELEPWPFTHVGRRVRIICGPMAGAEGILLAVKRRNRLVVSLSLLQRSVAVEVGSENAWPASLREIPLLAL